MVRNHQGDGHHLRVDDRRKNEQARRRGVDHVRTHFQQGREGTGRDTGRQQEGGDTIERRLEAHDTEHARPMKLVWWVWLRCDYQDLIPLLSQVLDKALEAVLVPTNVAERRRLNEDGHTARPIRRLESAASRHRTSSGLRWPGGRALRLQGKSRGGAATSRVGRPACYSSRLSNSSRPVVSAKRAPHSTPVGSGLGHSRACPKRAGRLCSGGTAECRHDCRLSFWRCSCEPRRTVPSRTSAPAAAQRTQNRPLAHLA
mmetsp:Transcript_3229/g.11701  ORF Transcript_3229/g.11701 Transcript_3229/m.11701 type:complete len:258 (+) Transcript_3229:1342-2115(+)|eukprot:scaffold51_cov401-Prasinococcus_capsulatus_cf.AAC.2